MNILVMLKQTFDTDETIILENGYISENGVRFIINPYDEYAVEEAIQLKESHGGEVTVISVGPPRTEEALRTALAMGADKAVLIDDTGLTADEYTIAKVLAAVIKDKPFDIILCGQMAVDDGSAQVGPRLAEELNIPHVSTIVNLHIEGDKAVLTQDVEGNQEVLEVGLPVLVTCQQGLNEPRYPSIPNKMRAKKKPLKCLSISDLGLRIEEITPKTKIVEFYLRPQRQAARILQGDIREQVKTLANLLSKENKVV